MSQSINNEVPEGPSIVRHFRSDTRYSHPEGRGSTDSCVRQAGSLVTALSHGHQLGRVGIKGVGDFKGLFHFSYL